jgi:hypothetical protein
VPCDPDIDGLACLLGQFKLDRATGFLLHDNGTLFDTARHEDIADSQSHQITAPELAVDGQVEQGQVARFPKDLKPYSD